MFAEYIYDQKNFLVKVTHDLNLIPQVISKLYFLITMNGLQKWFPLAITSYSKCYLKIRFLDNNEWLTILVSTSYNKLQ